MIYDVYFWWKGWEKRVGMYDSYHKEGISVYPPNPSRGWVIIGNPWPVTTLNSFWSVRECLKVRGCL